MGDCCLQTREARDARRGGQIRCEPVRRGRRIPAVRGSDGVALNTARPRDRPRNRAAVPPSSAHERVPSASLAPASLRLARERALEWEGGGAAGGPIAHSARSHSAHRDTGCPLAQAAADSRVARAQVRLLRAWKIVVGTERQASRAHRQVLQGS